MTLFLPSVVWIAIIRVNQRIFICEISGNFLNAKDAEISSAQGQCSQRAQKGGSNS